MRDCLPAQGEPALLPLIKSDITDSGKLPSRHVRSARSGLDDAAPKRQPIMAIPITLSNIAYGTGHSKR